MDSVKNATKGFAQMTGLEEKEEKTFIDELSDELSLTKKQRLYAFVACLVLGWIISFLSIFAIPQIATKPEKFATLYTIGAIISLLSTMFLMGPCKQIKTMFARIRVIATVVYLLSIVGTFVAAFYLKMAGVVILCLIFQMCAMVWYTASYIPFGRQILQAVMSKVCGCCVRTATSV